jgi:putative transposase
MFIQMTGKFQNKYRIPSARLQNWDYGNNGAYFITICTANRDHFFGEIKETRFIASEIGKLAKQFWLEISKQFPFIKLGNFVVMPNHVHGILIIDKKTNIPNASGERAQDQSDELNVLNATVDTRLIAYLRSPTDIPSPTDISSPTNIPGGVAGNKNPMLHENISRIIRWYKGRCSFEMRKIQAGFAWQSRFYDHIIRNAGEYQRIQNYIANNPINWKEDKFHE